MNQGATQSVQLASRQLPIPFVQHACPKCTLPPEHDCLSVFESRDNDLILHNFEAIFHNYLSIQIWQDC